MERGETEVTSKLTAGKCPYLAGRPPHGTYKLWPSSINVCYGRSQNEKGYGQVSKETQERNCFAGEGTYCNCTDYQRAVAAAQAPPEFGRVLESGEEAEDPVRRVKRRRRKKSHRRTSVTAPTMRSLAFLLTLMATVAVVVMALIK